MTPMGTCGQRRAAGSCAGIRRAASRPSSVRRTASQASEVMAIDAAPDGIVWVAGDGWIARYNGTWLVFSSANTPELDSQIGGMAVDPNGAVWVEAASEGPLRYDGTWTQIDPPEGTWPDGFSVAPDGSLWPSASGAAF